MLDKRQHARRRTLLEGRIVIAKLNGWAAECAVRNTSATGARVVLPKHVVVPPHFRLGISGGAPVDARLVWYRDGQAGIALAGP